MVKTATEAMDEPRLLGLELTAKTKKFVLSAYQVKDEGKLQLFAKENLCAKDRELLGEGGVFRGFV